MAFDPKDSVASDKINSLERDLYSRDAPSITTKTRPDLSPHERSNEYRWKEEDKNLNNPEVIKKRVEEKTSSFTTKFFLSAVLFFIVSASIAGYIILGGFNVISSKNVDISIQGLIAIPAGEELSLDIIIKNNNNTAIDSGKIFVEYPEGTRVASDLTKELSRDQFDFSQISAGGSKTQTIKAVLFGEKDITRQIRIRVDYKARGSNATFTKEKTFDITISSSPVITSILVPKEVNTGQEMEIKVEVASNSNTTVRDLLVRVEYPFGYSFLSANPTPTYENNIWRIGDLAPKEKRLITLKGRMDGQNEEERTFRFMTGTASVVDERAIGVGFINTQESLSIKKAFISLALQINSRSGPYVMSAGEKVLGTLIWTNNLPVAVNDVMFQIKLSGRGLDRSQVSSSNGGFFRSADNTITWDKNSLPSLRNIEPGQTGSVNFNFSALPASQQLLAQGRNMDIVLDASVSGTRIQSGVPQIVQSSATGQTKIGTGLVINGRVLRSIGPFINTGPIPPKADSETTYTVVLNVSNSFNDAGNVVLTTKLPPYVRWLNNVSPTTEQVTYDDSTRTVTWTIPDLHAGIGYATASKEVAFQISFLASLSQVGAVPELTSELTISGLDKFTGRTIDSAKPALSTRTVNDPVYRSGDERVRE